MDDTKKDIILNRTGTGPGSTPQEPLALVTTKMSHSELERSTFDSKGRSGVASAVEPGATSPEIRYGASFQHSYFSFSNISTVGRSVLYALRH